MLSGACWGQAVICGRNRKVESTRKRIPVGQLDVDGPAVTGTG